MTADTTAPLPRRSVLLPLLLLPLLLGALFDPVFRETADIDDLWELGCLAIAGSGLLLRILVAGAPGAGLATAGAHSLVRHPLALGTALVWLGLALFPRSWPALLIGVGVLWLVQRPLIARHDQALRERFGASFEAWARRTPAFLPAWRRWVPPASFSWTAALARESGTVFATVAAFFLLEVAGDVIIGEPLHVEAEWAVLLAGAGGLWLATHIAPRTAPALPLQATPSWQLEGLAVAAVGLLAWDASGADLVVAHWMGGANGFAWRDTWLASVVLHEGMRLLAGAGALALAAAVRWPFGALRSLSRRERVWLLGTVLLSMLAVGTMKRFSQTSCPWDLREFGGIAEHISHWQWGVGDGGPGHCFPAGHASGGFAFLAGAFALRRTRPDAARRWLVAALAFGVLMGIGQQLRGAHFTSHTLWSAWLCWACAWLSATVFLRDNRHP